MFQQENQGCGQLGYSTKEKKQKNKKKYFVRSFCLTVFYHSLTILALKLVIFKIGA